MIFYDLLAIYLIIVKSKLPTKSTWFDEKATNEERLVAFNELSTGEKNILKQSGLKPGAVPTIPQQEAYLSYLEKHSEDAFFDACQYAVQKKDLKSINLLLSKIKDCEMVIRDEEALSNLVGVSSELIALILDDICSQAYKKFSYKPTQQNYFDCFKLRRTYDLFGWLEPDIYPVNPCSKCIIKPPLKARRYTVKIGDYLSKISAIYYGQENLWDEIWERNGYKGIPDLIFPGSVLEIYDYK